MAIKLSLHEVPGSICDIGVPMVCAWMLFELVDEFASC